MKKSKNVNVENVEKIDLDINISDMDNIADIDNLNDDDSDYNLEIDSESISGTEEEFEKKRKPVNPLPIRTEFGRSLKNYGKWKDKVNMDRFIILTFLTAKEKEEYAKKFIGPNDGDVVYLDGKEWELKEIKP